MKFFISLFIILLTSLASAADLVSSLPSQIPTLDIPNADFVSHERNVIRGMSPLHHEEKLLSFGITDVLIFKNQTKSEVFEEINRLSALHFPKERIHHIPFQWKNYSSLNLACLQTIKALEILQTISKSKERKIYFHCTVGEDRTGHLAGLFRLINEETSIKDIFREELCAHGFSNGNKSKPPFVVKIVNGDLKKLFLMMAQKIERKELRKNALYESVCDDLTLDFKPEDFECE